MEQLTNEQMQLLQNQIDQMNQQEYEQTDEHTMQDFAEELALKMQRNNFQQEQPVQEPKENKTFLSTIEKCTQLIPEESKDVIAVAIITFVMMQPIIIKQFIQYGPGLIKHENSLNVIGLVIVAILAGVMFAVSKKLI